MKSQKQRKKKRKKERKKERKKRGGFYFFLFLKKLDGVDRESHHIMSLKQAGREAGRQAGRQAGPFFSPPLDYDY